MTINSDFSTVFDKLKSYYDIQDYISAVSYISHLLSTDVSPSALRTVLLISKGLDKRNVELDEILKEVELKLESQIGKIY